MDVLTVKDIAVIVTPFLTLIIGVGIGVIGYFLKSLHKDFREKVKETDLEIKRIEHELVEFKVQMPRQFVLKDDYIRTISVFEKKLDDIGGEIKNLIGRKNGDES